MNVFMANGTVATNDQVSKRLSFQFDCNSSGRGNSQNQIEIVSYEFIQFGKLHVSCDRAVELVFQFVKTTQ